ncbi:gliding motility-associated C-terminal domain-containing protein [Hymenobacter sp. GOD-10R]|uniref:DUF7948 domain-containing protein n=1 Tax=Hymenobacter sp. GOD-10R TaxID=3093922 RepID=UPI002D78C773|nr:gliding motility-associated C-terminal domain-containing protein [Hymenobacter sp. GOD-10R]WRQ29241.1 gliding motility-associated C-terminal domain-containing protein [Hymenobacter sp. GOD-10R]
MRYWRNLYSLFIFWSIATTALASPSPQQSLEFVENKGQWEAPARYVAELPAGRLFVETDGLTYAWLDATSLNHHRTAAQLANAPSSDQLRAHALRMRFVGASDQVALTSTEQTKEVRNYFRGSNAQQWTHHVRGFRHLHYTTLWPGIGARLYENQDQKLEYDFELAPAADPSLIRLRYEGGDAMALQPDGSLQIRTSLGTFSELAPQAWQLDAAGRRQAVACHYVLRGNEVSFQLGAYDPQRPLTIDPTVVYSSYTGATSDNWGFTATYDAQGNLYSGGISFGVGYPVTLGAYQIAYAGLVDIALIKYNTATTGAASRVWATYIGGNNGDFPHSLVVNAQNELVLLGSTSSSNYPTTNNAYDRTFGGGSRIAPYGLGSYLLNGSDIVVTRLSADGSQLLGSTYLGGSSNDGLLDPSATDRLTRNYGDAFRGDVLLDAAGNVYVASCTASADFPAPRGFSTSFKGGATDAVVCKLSPSLDQLMWSNFLGGTSTDGAYSLQLDAANNLYVAGGTKSANFPTVASALQPSYLGNEDGFIARISNDGTTLQHSTYLGTAAYEQAFFIQLDVEGNVYALGQTTGQYPVTAGHYQNTNGRIFIHKLTPDLGSTLFSTVIGSGGTVPNISPTAFLVDQCNRIYLSGWGGTSNGGSYGNGTTTGLPVTSNALKPTTDGNDFYLMQLSANATALDYATFFGEGSGADHVDGGTSRFDPRGAVYQSVCACGDGYSFPIPPGAGTFSTRSGYSNCNNAAFKFNFETYTVTAGPAQQVCVNLGTYPLHGSPAGGTWSGPGVSGSVASGFVFTPSAVGLGEYLLTYTLTGVGSCGGTSTTRLTVTPTITASFNPLSQTAFCLSPGTVAPVVTLAATPAGGQFSGPGVTGNQFYPNSLSAGTYTLAYTYSQNGCQARATQQLTVTRADAGYGFTTCSASAPTRLTGTPAGGSWSGPGVSGSAASGFFFTPTDALVGTQQLTYAVPDASGTCAATSTLQVTVNPSPAITIPSYPAYCVSNTTMVSLPANAYWSGRGVSYSNVYPAGYRFQPSAAGAGTHTLAYSSYSNGYCSTSGAIQITVQALPAPIAQPDTLLCPGSTQPIQLRASPSGGTWSGPGISATGRFTPPPGFSGSITAVYTYANGPCTGTITRKVSVAPVPTFVPAWAPALCREDREAPLRVHFGGVAAGAVWDFGDGTQATGAEVDHTYTSAGRYQPHVMLAFNNNKCSTQADLALIEVKPFRLPPNIITPNGDGLNDFFVASMACPRRLQIFSRWGNQVYESSAYQNNWDGGKQPAGVYYYLLYMADGTKYKGWLELQR